MSDLFKNVSCIGILGGTFNPIHKGHLMMAEMAMKQYPQIEKIVFMPNHVPAYKENDGLVSGENRINMIQAAIKDMPYAVVSDFELKRGGVTYTKDTLKRLHKINSKLKIYFIIGADSLFTLHLWKDYKDVIADSILLVTNRESDADEMEKYRKWILQDCGLGQIEFLRNDEVKASSSDIRKEIKSGKIPYDILPDGVADYIVKNKLYGCEKNES